jgi:hypothetical protein
LVEFSYNNGYQSSLKVANIVEIYMWEISKLHGVPRTIDFDKDSKFTSNFWKGLFEGFETNLNFIIAYHPESDGQAERVNRVIEDMLGMYVMDKPSKWKDYLHLVEFAYNNGYQESLNMSPFQKLYVRKWNTPVIWENQADHTIVGLDLLHEIEE